MFCLLMVLFFIATRAQIPSSVADEYYWKEYTGVVPPDALPGGKDLSGFDTYIGQAYIHNIGIFVAQIYPRKKEVEVPCYGVKRTHTNIKILCTNNKENFEWVSTNNTHFHVDMTGRNPIMGGYDLNNGKGMLHIGRLHFQGFLKIGEILSYKLEDARFNFLHNNAELSAMFYQVLVYQPQPVYNVDVTIITTTNNPK